MVTAEGAERPRKRGANRARSLARAAAVQALYQWQFTGQEPQAIAVEFREETRLGRADQTYFDRLFRGVPEHVVELDALFEPFLDRPIAQLGPVELAILRLGAFELLQCPEVPWRVVVNEAIDLAHRFGPTESHRYINSILDRAARAVRRHER